MSKSYFLGMIIAVFLLLFSIPKASAAWSLNTPERQWNPLWAGDALVWNDNRLGTADIFIRKSDGLIAPLVSSSEDEMLLGGSDQLIVYTAQIGGKNRLIGLNPKTKVMTTIADDTIPMFVSVMNQSVAWYDGNTAYWWKSGTIKSRALPATNLTLTNLGVVIINNANTILWDGIKDTVLPCAACLVATDYTNQIALLAGDGTISLWPSNTVVATADATQLVSFSNTVVYWQSGDVYIYRGGQPQKLATILPITAKIGSGGQAWSSGEDIVFALNQVPKINFSVDPALANQLSFSGTAIGEHVVLQANDTHGHTYTTSAGVINGQWTALLLPGETPDGHYAITGYAEDVWGKQSLILSGGSVTLDRTPPKIEGTPEITPGLDQVKIHFVTDEKSSAEIEFVQANQSNDSDISSRKLSRLTFSHTTTITGLDPGTLFDCRITSLDAAGNSLVFSRQFRTIALSDPSIVLTSLNQIVPNQSGVWQGQLLVEPGVISARVAVMLLDRPRLISWAIGRPPPGLARGSMVRIKATSNRNGTALLAHGTSAIIKVDEGIRPATANFDARPDAVPLFQWISFSGVLTSVTKTGWKVDWDALSVPVHWEQNSGTPMNHGQQVRLTGFLYLTSDDQIELAATGVELLDSANEVSAATASDISSATTVPHKVVLVAAPVTYVNTLRRENNINIVETSAIHTDKTSDLWYTLALIMSGVVIIGRFFFFHPKVSRRY